MMENSHLLDDHLCNRVLNRSYKFLIDYLDPGAVLDAFYSEGYLDPTQIRDIREKPDTSEKTRAIVAKVKSKGVQGYTDFKKILSITGQSCIVKHLQEQERQLNVTESEAAGPSQQETEDNDQSDDGGSLGTRQKEKSYRPPKSCCIYDGRLLKLNKKDIDIIKDNCTIPIGEGGSGEVYRSKADLEGFGMCIAVKKVPSDSSWARREKNVSRIMHPFILPLLAVVDKPTSINDVWFVSPFMENGDLFEAIKKDRNASDKSKIQMKCVTRIRILLQIALAIEYIHTEVSNVRGVILHKDISSRNIVLDSSLNARLIDFGLAREKNDQTTKSGGGKVCYLYPDYGKGASAEESWDYFAFGVVIREMLTGLPPYGDEKNFLSFWKKEAVYKKALDANVWKSDKPEIVEKVDALNDIAATCLDINTTKGWTATNFKKRVVDKLYETWESCSNRELYVPPKNGGKLCHMCIINPQASKSSLKQDHANTCTQNIKACISCEKNSFLNPIRCYCRSDLKPSIGYKWGALLVAGNDTDSSLAAALTKDLMEVKNLITSKAPLIMGISEKNVRIIVPDEPGKPDNKGGKMLSSKLTEEIEYFRELDIDTLLIYFSCHGKEGNESKSEDSKNTFKLDESDSVTKDEFEKLLNSLENIKNLLVILDRCFPPILKVGRQILQVNACQEDQEANYDKGGSAFTDYVIQGLKARSGEMCSDNCLSCPDFWMERKDFITVHTLFEYVRSHMEEKHENSVPDIQQKTGWNCIAYYSDEVVEIEFTSEDKEKTVSVQLKYLQDMRQLEDKIFEKFGEQDKTKKVKIKKDTFRKDNQFEVCDTLEKIMSAWTQRWPLTVVFEK